MDECPNHTLGQFVVEADRTDAKLAETAFQEQLKSKIDELEKQSACQAKSCGQGKKCAFQYSERSEKKQTQVEKTLRPSEEKIKLHVVRQEFDYGCYCIRGKSAEGGSVNQTDLEKGADEYIQNDRAAQAKVISGAFTTAGSASALDGREWNAVTAENNCCFDACLLEIIYGIESTFGKQLGDPSKAYGPFQLTPGAATGQGLKVTADGQGDERADLSKAAEAAAKLVYSLARQLTFKSPGACDCCRGAKAKPKNSDCCDNIRKLILAGYNAGDGVLNSARAKAKGQGGDPCKYEDVKKHLREAMSETKIYKSAPDAKYKETTEYIEKYEVLKKKLCSAY